MEFLGDQCAAKSFGPMNTVLTLLIHHLIDQHCGISSAEDWPEDFGSKIYNDDELGDYDFIITGAGTAGSILANRLSENGYWRVLVLDSGNNPPSESEIPYFRNFIYNTTYDWGLYAELSKEYGRNLPYGIPLTYGKILGGQSSVDNMLYIRGNSAAYNNWAKLCGPSWSYEVLLPLFKKSENMLSAEIVARYPEFHGKNGPLKIDSFNFDHETKECLLYAIREKQTYQVLDINAHHNVGVVEATGTISNYRRNSVVKSFLNAAVKRENVHLIKNAEVSNLEFDKNGKVNGVKFYLNDKSFKVRANKEIILSSGPFFDPKILMLSGIGKSEELQKFGIKTRFNLPGVGENFQDLLAVPIFFEFPCQTNTNVKMQEAIDYFKFLVKKSGRFSSTSSSDIIAFLDTKEKNINLPDIMVTYQPYDRKSTILEQELFASGYDENVWRVLEKYNQNSCVVQLSVVNLEPKSRGSLKLRSRSYRELPMIYANYLSDREEISIFRKGILLQKKLFHSFCFTKNNIREIKIPIIECDKFPEFSDEYYECYVRNMASSYQQASGTTKMGPKNGYKTVVDEKMRLYGYKNVRIVSPSIFPTIPSGSNNAPAIMLGEKAADLIKTTWKDFDDDVGEADHAVPLEVSTDIPLREVFELLDFGRERNPLLPQYGKI